MHGNLPGSLIERAKAPVLAKIREDLLGVPEQVARVLRILLEHLCDRGLNADQALKKAGIRSASVWGLFHVATGWSLGDYIKLRRLQIATYLLHYSDFNCTAIGHTVGGAGST